MIGTTWNGGWRLTKTGIGIDVHAFSPGDGFKLGGVWIPHTQGLAGHSDGDALIHAIVDALLGAAGLGDIGAHFPSSDPQWKDADSLAFLTATVAMVSDAGGEIIHLDATIVLQEPRLSDHFPAMQAAMGSALTIDPAKLNLKATTTDHLGFTGRNEGVLATAIATLEIA